MSRRLKIKVLWVGPFRDGSGWGYSSVDYVLALDAAGVDVVPRTLSTMENDKVVLPARFHELGQKSPEGCNVLVQHLPAHLIRYDGDFERNINFYFVESSDFRSSGRAAIINTMDEAWVCSQHNKRASTDSGVTIPISVLPCPINTERFERSYEPLPFKDEVSGSFLFYTIGDALPRKNFRALAIAFHLEFGLEEPVELVIKTRVHGKGSEEAKHAIVEDLTKIKNSLNLRKKYKDEIVITEYLTELEMMRLHSSCDCYVQPSFCEGWGVPCFDAMGFGKSPIATAYGGTLDYLSDSEGWLIEGQEVPVLNMQNVQGDLYSADQTWCSISITQLRRAMRTAYEDRGARSRKGIAGMERVYDFDYATVGRKMKNVFEREYLK